MGRGTGGGVGRGRKKLGEEGARAEVRVSLTGDRGGEG